MQLPFFVRTRVLFTRQIAARFLRSQLLRPRLIGWRANPVDGRVCDEDLAVLLGVGDIIGATDMVSDDPKIARARMAESSMLVEDEPCPDVRIHDRVLSEGESRIAARLYVPKGIAENSPGIVYYHGGGFVIGDLDTHDRFCQQLARDAEARVIAIDYRLAPENPFPAGVEDGVTAFRCVARRAKEFDMDPNRLALMGDSAGGNLSAVIAHKTKNDAVRPALQVLVYPAVDGSCRMKSHEIFAKGWVLTTDQVDWFYRCYVGDEPAARLHPDVSPLYADDFRGLPPALVYTAGFDPLRDEGIAYTEKLEKAGIPARHRCFQSLTHGFVSMGGICIAARNAASDIAREVGEALREEPAARAVA
jgi:acetyl esterase